MEARVAGGRCHVIGMSDSVIQGYAALMDVRYSIISGHWKQIRELCSTTEHGVERELPLGNEWIMKAIRMKNVV
jgi:hypothetical protein